MTLEVLQEEMIKAMKEHNKDRKEVISSLVSAVKLSAINSNCRECISEELVDKAILKELKTVNEQINSCPKERQDLLDKYNFNKNIIEEFAPKLMEEDEIKSFILEKFSDIINSKNKGLIMKTVMPELKGKADGKVINSVISSLL